MEKKNTTSILAQCALMAALCYIGFQFFRFDIPVGTDKTAIHFGNIFCVLAALLLGGGWGGAAGAVGMTIADLTSGYALYAPKTFILKLCIGLITGLIAHKFGKINSKTSGRQIFKWALAASVGGMVFNVFADPLLGYVYKRFLLGVPQDFAVVLTKFTAAATLVNAVITVIIATALYCVLRPALVKSGLFAAKRK